MTGPDKNLNLYIRGMKPSATVAINERSDALRADGRDIIKFGLGQSPFPVPEVVVQALRDHAHEKDYLPVKGLRQLRDAVATFHAHRDGIEGRTGDDVLIGPGSKELLFPCSCSTATWSSPPPRGSRMLPKPESLDAPSECPHRGQQRLAPPTRASRSGLCEEDEGRPRILVLNYPSNPTGLSFDAAQLHDIASIARKHQLVVVSDEIYGEVHHKGAHVSLARFYPEGTIVSAGLSKWCGAGGWRIGTFFFPPQMRWLLDAMATAASETYTSVCAPIQHASVAAFRVRRTRSTPTSTRLAVYSAPWALGAQRLFAKRVSEWTTPTAPSTCFLTLSHFDLDSRHAVCERRNSCVPHSSRRRVSRSFPGQTSDDHTAS